LGDINGRKAATAAHARTAKNKAICAITENAAVRENDGLAKKGSAA
jgi:hypothetical protein